jgi:hypothetical protein
MYIYSVIKGGEVIKYNAPFSELIPLIIVLPVIYKIQSAGFNGIHEFQFVVHFFLIVINIFTVEALIMKNIASEINTAMILQKFNELSLGYSMLKYHYKALINTTLWLYVTIRISLVVDTQI